MKLRREGLIWRRAGDEVIALDLTHSEYLASNATAACHVDSSTVSSAA